MRRYHLILLLAIGLSLNGAVRAQMPKARASLPPDNLVQNAGFEAEPITKSGEADGFPIASAIPNWTCTGKIWVLGAGSTRNVALMATTSSLKQTLNTVPGKAYELSFSMSCASAGTPVKTLLLTAGAERHTYTLAYADLAKSNRLWVINGFTFVARSARTDIVLQGGPGDGFHGPHLGDIYVVPVDEASVNRREVEGIYQRFGEAITRKHLDRIKDLVTPDFARVNSQQESQTLDSLLTELGSQKDRERLNIRFNIKQLKLEGDSLVAEVEEVTSYRQEGRDYVIVSHQTDTWSGGKGRWRWQRSAVASENTTVDGQPRP